MAQVHEQHVAADRVKLAPAVDQCVLVAERYGLRNHRALRRQFEDAAYRWNIDCAIEQYPTQTEIRKQIQAVICAADELRIRLDDLNNMVYDSIRNSYLGRPSEWLDTLRAGLDHLAVAPDRRIELVFRKRSYKKRGAGYAGRRLLARLAATWRAHTCGGSVNFDYSPNRGSRKVSTGGSFALETAKIISGKLFTPSELRGAVNQFQRGSQE